MKPVLSCCAVLALSWWLTACGGNGGPEPPAPDQNEPPAGTTISGGERLGWNQVAPSASAVRSYVFSLYIDGSRAALPDVRCGDSAGSTGFECSGALPNMSPGRHELQLTASAGGVESARSAILVVTFVSRQTSEQTPPAFLQPTDASGAAPEVCFETSSRRCYRTEVVARALGAVSVLASAGENDLLFVENSSEVRAVISGTLLREPALSLQTGTTISDIALDPDHARNGFVYLSEITEGPLGGSVRVVRYRMVQGRLGEAATIVAEIPAASSRVRIAVSRDRHIYVAMPGANGPRRRTGLSQYDGFVLRFAPTGSLPGDARAASPIYSQSYAQPAALAAGLSSDLWLAGSGGPVQSGFARVRARQAVWPHVPRLAQSMPAFDRSAVAACLTIDEATETTTLLSVPEPGLLAQTSVSAGSQLAARSSTAPLPHYLRDVSAIGVASNGVIYLSDRGESGRTGATVVRLVPRPD